MKVVVTGGSGRFGRALLPALAAQGLQGVPVGRADGVDLRGRTSLAHALGEVLPGADVLVHAATDPRHARAVDLEGTGKLLAAAVEHGVRHVIYLSIVGVDRVPFGYYRAKLDAETAVRSCGLGWTIVRSTQWFPFLASTLGTVARFGVGPRDWRFAPVDVDECAALVTRRVLAPPLDRIVEFGGPQEVLATRVAKDVSGHAVLHLGIPGRASKAVRDGALLPHPGGETGVRSWSDWLSTSADAR